MYIYILKLSEEHRLKSRADLTKLRGFSVIVPIYMLFPVCSRVVAALHRSDWAENPIDFFCVSQGSDTRTGKVSQLDSALKHCLHPFIHPLIQNEQVTVLPQWKVIYFNSRCRNDWTSYGSILVWSYGSILWDNNSNIIFSLMLVELCSHSFLCSCIWQKKGSKVTINNLPFKRIFIVW